MFVIMDLEWFKTSKHHICPTQIAALRVDDEWNTASVFYELICPQEGVSVPWAHVAFSGASADAFMNAHSAHAILARLGQWLRPDDVLCWWREEPAAVLKLLLKAIMKQNYPNAACILSPYFMACVRDGHPLKGDPYSLARKRGIPVPKVEHCSINDVRAVQRLMQGVKISTDVLLGPVPDYRKFVKDHAAQYLFLYDESTNLLHIPGSRCAENLQELRGLTTIKSCIANQYKPCPECCTAVWKKELKAYNEETVRRQRCGYFFFDDSKVFHRGTCRFIRLAARRYNGAVYYETCIKGGRAPCKLCKPEPEPQAEEKPEKQQTAGDWMRKSERRAFERYTQAVRERSFAVRQDMSASERRDMLTLTATNYAFWAAQGYRTFHLRSCRKLNGRTNLKGFETYQQAIHAGYQPCRECRPSKKDNMEISMPIDTVVRKEETLEDILAMCTRWALEHHYQQPFLSIRTPAAEWKINITMHPVVIYHKPASSNLFHEQHKMFLSVLDAIAYIAKHDRVKRKSLEKMLMNMNHKE